MAIPALGLPHDGPSWSSACIADQVRKSVWQGKAKQVSGAGTVAVARAAFRQRLPQSKKGKENKGSCTGESGDEGSDDDALRFECGSWMVEVEESIGAERFRWVKSLIFSCLVAESSFA